MRLRAYSLVLTCLVTLASAGHLLAEEPPVIAVTDALTPADERKAFTVPEGFDVQLVASEPDIQKPIQMAFDARGRLWVTTSYHYPFAAPAGKASDKLFILSDFDPASGKARKVEIFADDLNIPIGILPLPDCKSCIVSSVSEIPGEGGIRKGEIRKYTDTKGAGKADKMEVLFQDFGARDTHGMYNSYTYMPDGWVYACHGYSNSSKVKAKDGSEIEMQSGNTFRFRPDGSRIEVYTRGQVNPFGIAVDPWLNLYTADCHSKPITQLIPGAYYDSFGKPHDGLGYAPHVVHHDHGSTALCGLTWYDAEQFPKEYKGTMFLGNVVTNRINFDKIVWKGATPVGIEQPDFLVSKDPWFRPVDIKLGPDGALYVSDFYNKIIGHYEVPLNHPQRDKDRGRIWRIVWKGKDGSVPPPKFHRADFTTAKEEELYDDLFNSNLSVRFLAGHQLRKRFTEGKLTGEDHSGDKLLKHPQQMSAMIGWVTFIQEAGQQPLDLKSYAEIFRFAKVFMKDKTLEPNWLGGQVIRAMSSRPNWGEGERKLLLDAFQSFDTPHVRLACVESVTFHPHADFVQPLIEVLKSCPAEDTHMRQATRIALRNCLRDNEKAWPAFDNVDVVRKGFDPIYTEMAVAINKPIAAQFLGALLPANQIPPDRLAVVCEHIGRNCSNLEWSNVLDWLTSRNESAPEIAGGLQGLLRALQSRSTKLDDPHRQLIIEMIRRDLGPSPTEKEQYTPETVKRWITTTKLLAVLPGLMGSWDENRLGTIITSLEIVLKNKWCPLEMRASVADALMRAAPKNGLSIVKLMAVDAQTPPPLREQLLVAMAASGSKAARLDARDSLKDAPYRQAIAIGTALASSPQGAGELIEAIKLGKAPARLLQEKAIVERLRGAKVPNLDKQIADLTKGMPAFDQRIAQLMKERSTKYVAAKTDKELGAKLFAKHCGACHRIADQGGKIAPQLDGIGARGLERLLEDVLDPNRNVDQAFRARVITTKDDRTITGLLLRMEGEVVIIADTEGKEIRIPTKDIDKNRETMLSPMPANFGDVIPEADFYHLMAYLLDQRAKDPPKK